MKIHPFKQVYKQVKDKNNLINVPPSVASCNRLLIREIGDEYIVENGMSYTLVGVLSTISTASKL
jgi:hypothetical protein